MYKNDFVAPFLSYVHSKGLAVIISASRPRRQTMNRDTEALRLISAYQKISKRQGGRFVFPSQGANFWNRCVIDRNTNGRFLFGKEADSVIKILVDAPKSMIGFCKTSEAKEKPYDICLQCPFMAESCDGPNILAMEYPRWIEWVKNRIKQLKISRAEVAEMADIPLSTLASALSGASYDVKTDTMRRITRALIGGCWGQYPCHFASLLMDGVEMDDDADGKKVAALEEEVAALKEKLKRTRENSETAVQEAKREAQTKIDYLKEQVAIRDKYLDEKNKTIDRLMDRILSEKRE